jgi:hypothetical protein
VSSLALVLLGFQGRAWAQEDEDDDKLPPPVVHHVLHGHGSEAPEDDTKIKEEAPPAPAPKAKAAPKPEPDEDLEGPDIAPPPKHAAPAATPAESDLGPEPEPKAKPAPPKKHHKETKREKKERLRQEKLAKQRAKAHHGKPAVPTAAPEEVAPEEHRPVRGAPSEVGNGDEDSEPATVEHAHHRATHEAGEGEARRPSGDMDFDLLPQHTQSNEEATAIEGKIKTRRAMLQWHQAFGITTAVLMAGTVVTGQLNYSDRFGAGGSSGQYEAWHDTLEAATVVSFATAGLLAVLTPTPFEHKSDGVDTVTVHKWSMLIATIGMGAEVPLGIWTVTREGYTNQGTLALTHLIIGYVTAAALTTGASALFF